MNAWNVVDLAFEAEAGLPSADNCCLDVVKPKLHYRNILMAAAIAAATASSLLKKWVTGTLLLLLLPGSSPVHTVQQVPAGGLCCQATTEKPSQAVAHACEMSY